LEKAEIEGNLKGIRVCPGGPSMSHLLFVNDSLMLFRADRGDAQQLQSILQLYEDTEEARSNAGTTYPKGNNE
jgi:hypothetical protein